MEDPLTGLNDRKSLFSLIRRQVNIANEQNARLGLLVIDINDFGKLNNIHGYVGGDRVLQRFAEVLGLVQRSFDYAARIGDDRFALVLPNLANRGHAELAVHKLHRLLEVPFDLEGTQVRVSATVGIALCPDHATYPENLIKEAERALYAAQRSGRPFYMSAASDVEEISELWDLEVELQSAIKGNQLELYYQPKVSLHTGKPIGAEALIRWNSPSRNLVLPSIFIPIAEEAGYMKELTIWVLNSALRQSNDWTDKWGDLSVSVNVPPQIVLQPDFADTIANAIGLWKGSGEQLVIEITEQTLASDPERVMEVLGAVQEMGVQVSIDDFGTGYSSLQYFKRIPASELKIDQSFVRGLLRDPADADIVHLIIDLAHRFNLSVVAEGVEDVETLKELARNKCDVAQGYLFSKPLPHGQFNQWLENFRAPRSASSRTPKADSLP